MMWDTFFITAKLRAFLALLQVWTVFWALARVPRRFLGIVIKGKLRSLGLIDDPFNYGLPVAVLDSLNV